MLQLIAYQNPSITVSNIQKVTALRNSYQNRQHIGLAILWALGQGGMKDIQIGLKGLYFNLKFELKNFLWKIEIIYTGNCLLSRVMVGGRSQITQNYG
jgi:hypothetical protein